MPLGIVWVVIIQVSVATFALFTVVLNRLNSLNLVWFVELCKGLYGMVIGAAAQRPGKAHSE